MTNGRKASLLTLLALASLALAPEAARAQDSRFRASVGVAAAAGAGDANLAFDGSFGYRFSDRLWFEADVTGIDSPFDRFDVLPFDVGGRFQGTTSVGRMLARDSRFFRQGFPGAGVIGLGRLSSSTDGSTLIGTLGFRYDLPIHGGRLQPYLTGGVGLARTEQELTLRITAPVTEVIEDEVSHTGMALSAGVGASLRLFREVSLDMDARYFRLSRERNLARLGGGISVRF
jgi:opacity protein-like surface antigen